jgi:hypothetical protein
MLNVLLASTQLRAHHLALIVLKVSTLGFLAVRRVLIVKLVSMEIIQVYLAVASVPRAPTKEIKVQLHVSNVMQVNTLTALEENVLVNVFHVEQEHMAPLLEQCLRSRARNVLKALIQYLLVLSQTKLARIVQEALIQTTSGLWT